jgi:hypothetical protein
MARADIFHACTIQAYKQPEVGCFWTFYPVPSPCIADCLTLAEIAPRVGSYYTAFSLAASGLFGDPVAVIGRSKLFSASAVDGAIAKRNAPKAAKASV